MARCCGCLVVFLALANAIAAFEFVHSAADCRAMGMRCLPLSRCPQYRTAASVLRSRPTVCGFEGRGALICCRITQAGRRGSVRQPERLDAPMGRKAAPPGPGPGPRSSKHRHSSSVVGNMAGQKFTVAPKRMVKPNRGEFVPNRAPFSAVPSSPHLPKTCGQPREPTAGDDAILFADDLFAVRLPPVKPHILGGEDVPLLVQPDGGPIGHRWPWIVLFGRWVDGELTDWFCGGTLITDRHVLTAAHCFRTDRPETIGVRIGDYDLGTPDEVRHKDCNVSNIAIHPLFTDSHSDLAVVRLKAPVADTFSVEPICLPPAGAQHVGGDVEAAGWGMLEFDGDTSDILQQVPLRVIEPAVCQASYQRTRSFLARFPDGLPDSMVCAGSRDEERRDACAGDSGGPLTARRQDGTFELVGVISVGIGCGTEFPGLYTKVSAFIDWIVSELT